VRPASLQIEAIRRTGWLIETGSVRACVQARPSFGPMHFGLQRRRGDRARVPLRGSVLQLPGSGSFRHVTGDVGVDYSDPWTRGDDPSRADRLRGSGSVPAQIWSEFGRKLGNGHQICRAGHAPRAGIIHAGMTSCRH
jgi:hypothetical protein